jgi:hypothetical protein
MPTSFIVDKKMSSNFVFAKPTPKKLCFGTGLAFFLANYSYYSGVRLNFIPSLSQIESIFGASNKNKAPEKFF